MIREEMYKNQIVVKTDCLYWGKRLALVKLRTSKFTCIYVYLYGEDGLGRIYTNQVSVVI